MNRFSVARRCLWQAQSTKVKQLILRLSLGHNNGHSARWKVAPEVLSQAPGWFTVSVPGTSSAQTACTRSRVPQAHRRRSCADIVRCFAEVTWPRPDLWPAAGRRPALAPELRLLFRQNLARSAKSKWGSSQWWRLLVFCLTVEGRRQHRRTLAELFVPARQTWMTFAERRKTAKCEPA